MSMILFASEIAVPQQAYAWSMAKKPKTKYQIIVHNINSDTVLRKGSKVKILYTATKTKGRVTSGTRVKFKSSKKKVASVSKKGVIMAKKKGTAYITVYCKKKPSKKKKIKIRVGTPVSSISISGTRYLRVGRSSTLKAHPNSNATNKEVAWWSDNPAVATVNSSGKVKGVGNGVATIYATAKDGSGVSGSTTVYVRQYLAGDVKWIAHRGLHTSATENTAPAFEAAGSSGGFWGCECDIWETRHVGYSESLPENPTPSAINQQNEAKTFAEPANSEIASESVNAEADSNSANSEVASEPVSSKAASEPDNAEATSEPINNEVASEPVNTEDIPEDMDDPADTGNEEQMEALTTAGNEEQAEIPAATGNEEQGESPAASVDEFQVNTPAKALSANSGNNGEDPKVTAAVSAIRNLGLNGSETMMQAAKKKKAIKAAKAAYDALNAQQKYQVRVSLKNGSKEGLKYLLDAAAKVAEYDSIGLAINHDSTFASIWGNGNSVRSMTRQQIEQELPGVCFLEKYLDICKRWNMVPVIEFKDPDMSNEAVYKALEMVEEKGLLGKAVYISFYVRVLQQVNAQAGERLKAAGIKKKPVTYYLISEDGANKVNLAASNKFTGVSLSKNIINSSLYSQAKSRGLGVGTWTYKNQLSDDEKLFEHMFLNGWKLDFVTVDYHIFK